jgi:hypothetical protein
MIAWEIKGRELVNCNCAYGCPCQFDALPTYGQCQAVFGIEIEKGHFGDVDLSGLRLAGVYYWPGAVHEGKGKAQPVIDERASAAQREALLNLISGEHSDPFATMFSVYASTMETVHEPIFAPIDFEVDVEGRKGRIHVDGLIDTVGEPIRNAATGQESRARIDLPNGFEYAVCEVGSASTATGGKIPLKMENSHGQFNYLHMNNHGVIR